MSSRHYVNGHGEHCRELLRAADEREAQLRGRVRQLEEELRQLRAQLARPLLPPPATGDAAACDCGGYEDASETNPGELTHGAFCPARRA